MAKAPKKTKEEKATSRVKGEEGYWERSVDAAHEAAAKARAVFETAEDFEEAAEKYFEECDANNRLYGEAGLCLGLTKYNKKGKKVLLNALRKWYDGETCGYLQEAVQTAYMRIQNQIESDPRYYEAKGMSTKAIFLHKQARFGGYQDKMETKNDSTVKILFGDNMDAEDFK